MELDAKLRQAHDVMCLRGEACDFGCAPDSIADVLSIAKAQYPDRPYCVVTDWIWVDIHAPQSDRDSLEQTGLVPCFIFALNVLDDEARRPHIGPMVRTSLLQHFEQNCLFVTANTVYILTGHGKRTSVTPEVAMSITF